MYTQILRWQYSTQKNVSKQNFMKSYNDMIRGKFSQYQKYLKLTITYKWDSSAFIYKAPYYFLKSLSKVK